MSSTHTDGGSRLDWPQGFDRTPEGDRTRNRKFDVSMSRAFSDLETELDRIGVDAYSYGFDADQRKTDNRPYSRARPDDPGFVLRWTMDGDDYAVACDEYTKLRDNVRAVGLYLREKRKMENRPVVTGQSEFATARLPPADEDAIAAPPTTADRTRPPHEVLGVAPDAPDATIKGAFRELVKQGHADGEGRADVDVDAIRKARDAMLGGDDG